MFVISLHVFKDNAIDNDAVFVLPDIDSLSPSQALVKLTDAIRTADGYNLLTCVKDGVSKDDFIAFANLAGFAVPLDSRKKAITSQKGRWRAFRGGSTHSIPFGMAEMLASLNDQ